jgi:hypothetical protein
MSSRQVADPFSHTIFLPDSFSITRPKPSINYLLLLMLEKGIRVCFLLKLGSILRPQKDSRGLCPLAHKARDIRGI